ncbi:MAG: Rho termination factor N-terminal domain-containing protein, partial [Actinomycetes bacterium]
MTESSVSTASRGGGLSSMLLPELKQLASQLGISGASGMRKGDLVAAISERQGSGAAGSTTSKPRRSARREQAPAEAGAETAPAVEGRAAPAEREQAPARDGGNDKPEDRGDRNDGG